jgi:hypothetical protein
MSKTSIFKLATVLFVCATVVQAQAQKGTIRELKFNASSLYNNMIDGGAEVIKKDIGYEFSIRGSNEPTLEKRTMRTDTIPTNRFGVGARINFYKRTSGGGISGRYASIFTNYNTKSIGKGNAKETTNVMCVGISCGKKWIMYNHIGFQADLGIGYDIFDNKPITAANDWIPKTVGKNDTDISFLYNVQLPLRLAIIVRL